MLDLYKLCAREDNVDHVDLEKLFYKNVTFIRSLFDKADNSSVHISTEGAQSINRKLDEFFHSPKPCVQELHTPMDHKRKRSDGTTTPTSADRMKKKNGQNKLWQRVKTENGEYKCDIDSILNEQVQFYTKLFATEGWDKTAGEQLCQFIVDK
ncbi:Hypothetical predicted protein, partial [Mytilus galloprovincialis]